MRKIIVTGATGQDGSYMCDYLLENTNDTVIAAVRRTSQAILSNLNKALENPRLKLVTLDITDGNAIRKLVRDEKPDYFINLAAQTYVADSWNHPKHHFETNTMPLIDILEAIREYNPKCRVYQASSSECFGDVIYSPQDINHPFRPRSIYGASKCAASHICKVYKESYNLYIVNGFLFNHESPRRQEYFVTRKITKEVAKIKQVLNNGSLAFYPLKLGNVYAERDWSHAKDFCDGIWKMLHQSNSKEIKNYVLASGETHSVKEFVEKAFKFLDIQGVWLGEGLNEEFCLVNPIITEEWRDKRIPLVKIDPNFYRPAEVEKLCGDSEPARKELGWQPRYDFDMLVNEMVTYDYLDLIYGK